jgi:DNA-directed RNA polymerase specialized sigma24 family protein
MTPQDPKKTDPVRPSTEVLDDDDGPVSSSRPVPPSDDEVPPGDDAVPADGPDVPRVDAAVMAAFLADKDIHRTLRRFVKAHCVAGTPRHVVDDILQTALVSGLEPDSLPPVGSSLVSWMFTIAAHKTADHFRSNAMHARWQNREVDVEQTAGEPGDDPPPQGDADYVTAPWMLDPWLGAHVAHRPRDLETLELLREKARTEKTYEQLAAELGTTAVALETRVYRFRKKYQPIREQFEKRRRMIIILIVGGVLIVIALVLLFWPRARPEATPDRSVAPRTRPSPTASSSSFDQALPPPSSTVDPDGKQIPPR